MWPWRNSKGKERLKKSVRQMKTGSSLLELKLRH